MREVIFGLLLILGSHMAASAIDQYAEQQGESTKIASTK